MLGLKVGLDLAPRSMALRSLNGTEQSLRSTIISFLNAGLALTFFSISWIGDSLCSTILAISVIIIIYRIIVLIHDLILL